MLVVNFRHVLTNLIQAWDAMFTFGSLVYVEAERELLRNDGLTFPLINNEYIYT